MLIDALVAHFTRGRQRFDKDARIARSGRSILALLDELMRDPQARSS
jgi:1,6-anhydro-N-acetylmuramate kinase